MCEDVFDGPGFFGVFYKRVEKLVLTLETDHYGIQLALYLHYECRMTLPKILEITQAACKRYDRACDSYGAKALLQHRFIKDKFIKVPRLSPPVSRLVPIIRSIEATLGVEHDDNGKIAFRGITELMQELMVQDCGKHLMPKLSAFTGGKLKLPIVIQFDGTGFGMLSINTAVVRNPFMPQSSQQLRPLGVGTSARTIRLAPLDCWPATSPSLTIGSPARLRTAPPSSPLVRKL
jgi:hypothetical protein